MREELDHLFSAAVHDTATPFVFSEYQAWMGFFFKLRPHCHVPFALVIGGLLLDDIYEDVIARVVDWIRQSGGDVMSVDCATNNLARSKSNVILFLPVPLFVEYL